MNRKNKFSREELLKIAQGVVFGKENGKLPLPPMLMISRILDINEDGGQNGKGQIRAELDIEKSNWFFDCHFKNDPVMPGCLGLDGFWQLIGFFLSWIGGKGRGRALGVKELKFKGQVRPYHKKVTYIIDLKRVVKRPVFMAWANAILQVDGRDIYFAKDLQVGLFDNLTWDYGLDPSLDTF